MRFDWQPLAALLAVLLAGLYILRQFLQAAAGKKECGSCGSCARAVPEAPPDPRRIPLL